MVQTPAARFDIKDPSLAPLLTLGQEVLDVHSASSCFDVTGYVPLYQPIAGTPRVIGFGHVKLTALGPCPGAVQITLLATPSAGNATAHLVDGIPVASPGDAAAVLREQWEPQGFEVELTGPWPAYNFVSGAAGIVP